MNDLLPQKPDSPFDALIQNVRGHDVMLDSDLAAAYQVSTREVNQAVSRNPDRFPEEFSFQIEQSEWDALRSQSVILNAGRGQHRKYLPRVFTEHGAVMLATVLNSPRAIEASKDIVRAFVRLRHAVNSSGRASIYEFAEQLLEERDRRMLAEDRVEAFRPRMPYGTPSKINGQPRTSLVAAYFRHFRNGVIRDLDEYQRRLFDFQ